MTRRENAIGGLFVPRFPWMWPTFQSHSRHTAVGRAANACTSFPWDLVLATETLKPSPPHSLIRGEAERPGRRTRKRSPWQREMRGSGWKTSKTRALVPSSEIHPDVPFPGSGLPQVTPSRGVDWPVAAPPLPETSSVLTEAAQSWTAVCNLCHLCDKTLHTCNPAWGARSPRGGQPHPTARSLPHGPLPGHQGPSTI